MGGSICRRKRTMISHVTFPQSFMSVPAVTPTYIFLARNKSSSSTVRFDCLCYEVVQYEAKVDLRHSKFAGLREDKHARMVIKEHGG